MMGYSKKYKYYTFGHSVSRYYTEGKINYLEQWAMKSCSHHHECAYGGDKSCNPDVSCGGTNVYIWDDDFHYQDKWPGIVRCLLRSNGYIEVNDEWYDQSGTSIKDLDLVLEFDELSIQKYGGNIKKIGYDTIKLSSSSRNATVRNNKYGAPMLSTSARTRSSLAHGKEIEVLMLNGELKNFRNAREFASYVNADYSLVRHWLTGDRLNYYKYGVSSIRRKN